MPSDRGLDVTIGTFRVYEDGELNCKPWMHIRPGCQKHKMKKANWKERLKVRNLAYWLGLKTVFGRLNPTALWTFSPSINIGFSPLMHLSVYPSRLRVGNISGSSVQDSKKIQHKQAVELLAVKQEAKGGIWSGSRHNGKTGETGKWAGCVGKGRDGSLRSHLESLEEGVMLGTQRSLRWRGGWCHLGPDFLFSLGSDSGRFGWWIG